MTRSGPYHGLPEDTGLRAVFLMEILPLPMSSEAAEGVSFTALPANEGEERAIVAAIVEETVCVEES